MIVTKEQKITLVFTGLLILGFIIFKISSCNKPVAQYTTNDAAFEKKIEQLNKTIKEQEISIKSQDSIITMIEDSMAILKFAIKSKEQQIKNLKAQNEKVRIDISKYTNADIQKFLSNRYGK